jgi:hypothetical protein
MRLSIIRPPITAANTVKKTIGLASKVSHSALFRRLKITRNSTSLSNQPPRTAPKKPFKDSFDPMKKLRAVRPVKTRAAKPPAKAANTPGVPAMK